MYIEGHDNLGNPFKLNFSRILVYDDYGNVIAAIVKYKHGAAYIGRIGESDFEDYIAALGLRNTTIVDTFNTDNLPKLKVK